MQARIGIKFLSGPVISAKRISNERDQPVELGSVTVRADERDRNTGDSFHVAEDRRCF